MPILPVVVALIAASSSFALTPAERVGAIALEIGAPLPAETLDVAAPDPRSRAASEARAAAASGYVSASDYLTGSVFLFCNSGWMNGSTNLTANMSVRGPDGVSGTIPVSGFISLSGSCQHGAGYVSGSTTVSGSGALYDRDGKRAGTARLSGTVFVNQYVSSQYVWISQYASLTGRFDAD